MKNLFKYLFILLCQIGFSQTRTVTTSGGTTSRIPLFTGSSVVGNSIVSESGNQISIGTAAVGIDYSLKFNGATEYGLMVWNEGDQTFQLTSDADPYYIYPSSTSLMVLTCVGGNENRAASYASISASASGGTLTGFWGGYVDSGSSAFAPTTIVANSGWNYFTATNTRTLTLVYAGQFANEISSVCNNLTISNAFGIDVRSLVDYTSSGVANLTTSKAININDVSGTGITVGTNYGLYINSITKGTTDYAIYTNSGDIRLGGAVGIGGINTPTAFLHLPASTSSANTASMKIPVGTLQSTTEVGTLNSNSSGAFYQGKLTTGTTAMLIGYDGAIYTNLTDVGNITTGEDNLMTYTLPASALNTNKDYIEIEGIFEVGTSAFASKVINAYLGSSLLCLFNPAASNDYRLKMNIKLFRTGAATQKLNTTITINDLVLSSTSELFDTSSAAETLANALVIKFTGTSDTTNDIVQTSMTVKYFPNIN